VKKTSGLAWTLLEDRTGALWIGSNSGGLIRINPGRTAMVRYRNDPANPDSLSPNIVLTLFQDHEESIWAGVAGGVIVRIPGHGLPFVRITQMEGSRGGLLTEDSQVAFEDSDGMVWAGSTGVVTRIDRSGRLSTRHAPGFGVSDVDVISIAEDPQGFLWFGTKGGGLSKSGTKVSLADLIVLGGTVAVEKAAKEAGYNVQVAFAAGRVDAKQDQTDVASFSVLEPAADGFRNYYKRGLALSPAEMLVERAKMLNLTVPEMTVLIGGMRALNSNSGGASQGVFTDRPGALSNDFFVNLLDMSTRWTKSPSAEGLYDGVDRKTGKTKWSATPVDLVFGSNSELRAVAEVYAADDGREKFVQDFAEAWTKVMNLDRFDLR